MKSQWQCLFENVGQWQGSFTSMTIAGAVLEEIPSLLILEALEPEHARITLTRESPKHPQPLVLDFTSLSRSLLFFETGAFCQGSMQYAPNSQFGVEFGLIHRDRRFRLLALYNSDTVLETFTIMREQRVGSEAPEQPPLQVEDLLGQWQGSAVTLYPDGRNPEPFTSELNITRSGSTLTQELSFAGQTIASTAQIEDNRLKFDSGVEILLLPDRASLNAPGKIAPGQPFFVELGWMPEPNLRQRLIRSYDAQGEWVSLTLAIEQKKA
jgi:Domain of unknown function (DUF3598)